MRGSLRKCVLLLLLLPLGELAFQAASCALDSRSAPATQQKPMHVAFASPPCIAAMHLLPYECLSGDCLCARCLLPMVSWPSWSRAHPAALTVRTRMRKASILTSTPTRTSPATAAPLHQTRAAGQRVEALAIPTESCACSTLAHGARTCSSVSLCKEVGAWCSKDALFWTHSIEAQ
jgi:hypothetical protein